MTSSEVEVEFTEEPREATKEGSQGCNPHGVVTDTPHLGDIMEEWAGGTSIHGIPFLFQEGFSRWNKIMWASVVIFVMGMLISQVSELVGHYYTYPYSTSISFMELDELSFPDVHICQNNPLNQNQISVAPPAPLMRNWTDMFGEPSSELWDYTLAGSVPSWVIHSPTDGMPMNMLNSSQYVIPGSQISLLPLSCVFANEVNWPGTLPSNGETPPACHFELEETDMGRCFKIKVDKPVRSSYDTLDVLMYAPASLMPDGMQPGLFASLTEQGAPVNRNSYRHLMNPNELLAINLQKQKLTLLEYPYEANCDPGAASLDSCYSECYRENLKRECSCRSMGDPDTSYRFCDEADSLVCCIDPTMMGCASSVCDQSCSFEVGAMGCDCPKPCVSSHYEAKSTRSVAWKFSAENMIAVLEEMEEAGAMLMTKNMARRIKLPAGSMWLPRSFDIVMDNLRDKNYSQLTEWYINQLNEDMYRVSIRFDDLMMENIEQTQDFPDTGSILSSLGGLFGFWTGYSAVSFFEVADLIVLRLLSRFCGVRKRGGLGSQV